MYAEKLILETDEQGYFKQPFHLPPNSKIEIIALVLETLSSSNKKRKPAIEIAGKATFQGDMTQPIIPLEDWQNLP